MLASAGPTLGFLFKAGVSQSIAIYNLLIRVLLIPIDRSYDTAWNAASGIGGFGHGVTLRSLTGAVGKAEQETCHLRRTYVRSPSS